MWHGEHYFKIPQDEWIRDFVSQGYFLDNLSKNSRPQKKKPGRPPGPVVALAEISYLVAVRRLRLRCSKRILNPLQKQFLHQAAVERGQAVGLCCGDHNAGRR